MGSGAAVRRHGVHVRRHERVRAPHVAVARDGRRGRRGPRPALRRLRDGRADPARRRHPQRRRGQAARQRGVGVGRLRGRQGRAVLPRRRRRQRVAGGRLLFRRHELCAVHGAAGRTHEHRHRAGGVRHGSVAAQAHGDVAEPGWLQRLGLVQRLLQHVRPADVQERRRRQRLSLVRRLARTLRDGHPRRHDELHHAGNDPRRRREKGDGSGQHIDGHGAHRQRGQHAGQAQGPLVHRRHQGGAHLRPRPHGRGAGAEPRDRRGALLRRGPAGHERGGGVERARHLRRRTGGRVYALGGRPHVHRARDDDVGRRHLLLHGLHARDLGRRDRHMVNSRLLCV